ncbi:hypothetical protein HAZT_HAZT004308 [Hyalella azteca]|uniref:Tctex1 domain-containing protein 2 n=1 Tax=Hyalella azteca TaxID=294128 RepID=A0A6A0H2D9_HYAAZ|nr:hypothetical protein HAZT_HAZT004308 [Hyalella azteca]
MDANQNFQIRPPAKEKLRASVVKEILHTVMVEQLSEYRYDEHNADETVNCLELSALRYKVVVNAVLGEQRGGGVKIGARCLWDTDTDNSVHDNFLSVSIMSRRCLLPL